MTAVEEEEDKKKNNNNNNKAAKPTEQQQPTGLDKEVVKQIEDSIDNMLSDSYFAEVVRKHLATHPDEYSSLMKRYRNDFSAMCVNLTAQLNNHLSEIVVENPDYRRIEDEVKELKARIQHMLATSRTEDLVRLGLDRKKKKHNINDMQMEVIDLQSQLEKMEVTKILDKRYHDRDLSGLISKVRTALATIDATSEPSDIDARKAIVFEKRMPLENAIFSLLFNTRHETIPISVLNLKGWTARLAKRIKEGEYSGQNQPTMLILRSRTDNGEKKGNAGKTTIVHSLVDFLQSRNLNTTGRLDGIEIPTEQRIDTRMSDKTLVFFDDMTFNNVAWETLNRFLDGGAIRNRGKYQREFPILPFGNIIGTTNEDLTYTNKERYPVIEFTPNNVAELADHPCVKANVRFTQYDESRRVFDLSGAWETLLAYATENHDKWLAEYAKEKTTVAMGCSVQRSKLENIIIAYVDEQIAVSDQRAKCNPADLSDVAPMIAIMQNTFRPADIIEYIKNRNLQSEFGRRLPQMNTILSALLNLGIEMVESRNKSPYQARFKLPSHKIGGQESEVDSVSYNWQWISENASRPPSEQKRIAQ